jgi:putative membrane protein
MPRHRRSRPAKQADEAENLVRVSGIVAARTFSNEEDKMKTMVSAVCCVALGCVLSFAQGAGPAMTDQQFVDFAAQTDMLEANLGQLAATQSSSQGVKDYAQMLVTDHTDDYTQLGVLGGKDNLDIPKGLDAAHDKMIAPFKNLKGAAFDHRYIQEMIAGHTKAIQVYTKEAADAQSADVKAYANQTLPTLQKHLDGAKNLAKAKPSSKCM